MTDKRVRPGLAADERTQLTGWLDLQRDVIRWKCEGVAREDTHRAVLPRSPHLSLAGLVSHMRWVEHCWFEVIFMDHPAVGPQFEGEDDDADMRVEDVPLAQLLAQYTRQCAVSDEIIAAHSLDDLGRNKEYRGEETSLRWMLLHMIEETARHAGHADAIRELLDGELGYY
ncbi:DinB family protein [Streptomyces sp. SID14478]|uniref:DinB family protein n=1 Tax=Streptomyces sp. SID14478 TaxID=2706073 RepID=UPI0013D8E3FF|nr:DinB family protein [Streptomyces sp. SID14478]NEB78855.1 DinB family protein [Streptomyces sp. SID14478]